MRKSKKLELQEPQLHARFSTEIAVKTNKQATAKIGSFRGRKLEIKKEGLYFRAYFSKIDLNIYKASSRGSDIEN